MLRLGLRRRVSVAFGLGAFLIALFVALTTYAASSTYLSGQRDTTTLRQASFNARVVAAALATGPRPAEIAEVLERLDARAEASAPLVWWGGRWYADRFTPGMGSLPGEFVAAAQDGQAVRQRLELPQGMSVAIAIPVTGGAYVEVFPLIELDAALNTLAITFAGTTTLATVLGVLLGRWASSRALRPLTEVTAAAGAIAAGNLDARLGERDDPDLDSIAEAFDRTAANLQARLERDARFAADVAHELRSPLTTMVNAVNLLRAREGELEPETREVLVLLSEDVHRFSGMVTDLLDLSRPDPASGGEALDEVPVASLVRSVADRVAGRPVTRVVDGADPTVRMDPRRLERIVENLVRNAETHGRGVTDVTVAYAREVVRVVVDDAGPGVPRAERDRVFERFARGQTSTGSGGVGLGLALVAEHVAAHDGRVWVEDSPTGGARFVLELPRWRS